MESLLDAVGAGQPNFEGEEDGWPITDIIEELDDDDNVVSYRLISADDSISRVQAALEKAGVTGQADSKPTTDEQAPSTDLAAPDQPASIAEPADADASPPPKKTVSFSDDVLTQDEEPLAERSFRARRVEQIMNTAKEQEKISQEAPIIPEDEDPEDAALRQEMLKYGMGEIGAVVAELQLEEGDSDDSGFDYVDEGFDEDEEDEDNGDNDDDDEDDLEDEYGRNGRVVTDKYRRRMLELEKKLGIQSQSPQAQPVGNEEDSSDDEGIGRIVVKPGTPSANQGVVSSKPPTAEQEKSESNGKKSVRFASSLDIAPETEPPASTPINEKEKEKEREKEHFVDPLSDIVERSPSFSVSKPKPSKKASRFKTAASQSTSAVPRGPLDVPAHFADQDRPSAPSGPAGTTIANTLVEREPDSAPVAPDEFDGSIAYQEVADEYQKMRRRFIQREGGFLKEDESPVQPVIDEDKQEPMSRFKAARLSRQ
ncbi:hypothetical protein ESCO_000347 [Escovopsis weberi]|uniref:DUF3835 domain-containing protein n=1 Tax=Escovopsis weberi TaxID=150374 RepID=A0A0M9VUC4_ESCWE|nr:hypothetical protein ESCO_000347 [Escovopsis weberi]